VTGKSRRMVFFLFFLLFFSHHFSVFLFLLLLLLLLLLDLFSSRHLFFLDLDPPAWTLFQQPPFARLPLTFHRLILVIGGSKCPNPSPLWLTGTS